MREALSREGNPVREALSREGFGDHTGNKRYEASQAAASLPSFSVLTLSFLAFRFLSLPVSPRPNPQTNPSHPFFPEQALFETCSLTSGLAMSAWGCIWASH